MEIQLRLVTGLLYIVAIVKNQTPSSKPQCAVVNLKANCTSRNFTAIPENLDMKITDLDVSLNPIEILSDDDFKRYKCLLTLRLHGLNPATGKVDYGANTFAPLMDLYNLDMSESPFNLLVHKSDGLQINWPKKIKFLSVSNFGRNNYSFKNEDFNLSTLTELNELYVAHHELQKFPELNLLAPIRWVDLDSNPLRELTAESLAPFCTIVFLRVGQTSNHGLESVEKEVACRCHRVEQWMLMFNIQGFKITCSKADEDVCPNKKNFSETMINQRKICLDRQPTSNFWKWLLLLALISLLLPAAYIGNEYYKRYKMKKGTDDSSSATSAPENGAVSPEGDDIPGPNLES